VPPRPARLPDAVVGLLPHALDVLDQRPPARPQPSVDRAEALGGQEGDAGHLAVDVQLELLARRVADPHRPGVLVPRQVGQLELGQAALAADPVHDLELRWVAGGEPQDIVAEGHRLVGVAAAEQRPEGEDRVAQPAVAVVPVRTPPRSSGKDAVGAATSAPVVSSVIARA
jgi:hypothetical protein